MKNSITDSQEEMLIEVDKNNQVIGPISRGLAHKSPNKYYRTIYILVFDNKDRILIQKRSATKDLYPNCWDISVGGHVDFGNSYTETAVRELKEELGIEASKEELEFVKEVLVKLPNSNEFFYVYKYFLKPTDKLNPQLEEISNIKWISIKDIQEEFKTKPEEWYARPIQVINSLYS